MRKIKAFTMLEILVISILLSIGLFSLYQATLHAKQVNEKVTQSIIANQLATEGVETIYQLRNTNFLKYKLLHSNENNESINKCWLALSYDECIGNTSDDNILGTGYYYIKNTGLELQIYTGTNTNIIDNDFAVCLNSGTWVPCPQGHQTGNDESKFGKFYRAIRGIGDFDMSTNETGGTILDKKNMTGSDAQEYRFCSTVARIGGQGGELEICSTMTNFID